MISPNKTEKPLNFGKTAFENLIAIETSNHATKQLTHQNVPFDNS